MEESNKNKSHSTNPFILFLILILLIKSFETAGFFNKN